MDAPPTDAQPSAKPSWEVIYGLTWEDFDRLQMDAVVGRVPMRVFPCEVRHVSRKADARVVAITEADSKIHRLELAASRC